MESKVLPRTISVKLSGANGDTEGVVKKIALGDFAKLAGMVEEILKGGGVLNDITSEAGTQALLAKLKDAPEKIADIVSLVSSFTKEQILESDIESVMDILAEAWKLNNLVKMFSGAVKKAMGSQADPISQETQALGLTEQSPE